MSLFETTAKDNVTVQHGDVRLSLLKKKKWAQFDASILGLGDISVDSIVRTVICTIFDLEEFTKFSKQMDPQLAVPVFLNDYLGWFFDQIKAETQMEEYDEGIQTWHDLPFFVKFMGDGMLLLFGTEGVGEIAQRNILTSCLAICNRYRLEFYGHIKQSVSDVPNKLRCGIAKGNVSSVGNRNDYVGPCINFASRLQNLPGSTIAFANRGFNVETKWTKEMLSRWLAKSIFVKGIGDSELIYIRKREYEQMSSEDQEFYSDP